MKCKIRNIICIRCSILENSEMVPLLYCICCYSPSGIINPVGDYRQDTKLNKDIFIHPICLKSLDLSNSYKTTCDLCFFPMTLSKLTCKNPNCEFKVHGSCA